LTVVPVASKPSLSSIDHGSELVGYESARWLDRMMRGTPPPKQPILLRNMHLVVRQSTDVTVLDDQDVAQAVSYMRRHAVEGISVKDVLRAVPMSRRVLEQKCRKLLGRSPAEEIRRQRIARAKILLVDTQLTMEEIATRSGFRDADSFSRRFRQEEGLPPSAYRKNAIGNTK